MKLILFLAFVLNCNGFLLDSNTETPPSGLDEKRYNSLMDLLIEERRSRKNLEAAVSRELMALKQEVSRCQCNNGNVEVISKNETDKLKSEMLELQNEHKRLELKLSKSEQNNTALTVRVQQLEHELSVMQSPTNLTNAKQLANALQNTNSQLNAITNDVNTRKQDFIALYQKLVVTEDRLENVSTTLKIEQNKTFTTLHNEILNSSQVTEQKLSNKIGGIQALQNATILKLDKEALQLQQHLNKEANKAAVTLCMGASKVYNNGDVITFNQVKISRGLRNIYRTHTNGVFTCETAGMYLVTSFVQIKYPSGGFRIYHGSTPIADAFMYLTDQGTHYQTGSASVITRMEVYDTISVQAGGAIYVYGGYESCLTVLQID